MYRGDFERGVEVDDIPKRSERRRDESVWVWERGEEVRITKNHYADGSKSPELVREAYIIKFSPVINSLLFFPLGTKEETVGGKRKMIQKKKKSREKEIRYGGYGRRRVLNGIENK